MKIRNATPDDAAAVQAIYAPFVLNTSISFETTPPTVDEMKARIEAGLDKHAYLVAEKGGLILGYAYGSTYRPRPAYDTTAEVSVYLSPDAQGQGLGRRLYDALINDLKAKGFKTLVAVVTTPNPGSDALHEKCGFMLVGTLQDVGQKFGNWHGTSFYQLVFSDDA